MSIADRFEQIIDHKRLNYRSLAKELKFSDTAIRNIAQGKSKPKFEVVEAVYREFPEINMHWLITGEGDMLGVRKDFEDVLKFLEENIEDLANYPRFQDIISKNKSNKSDVESLRKRIEALEKKSM